MKFKLPKSTLLEGLVSIQNVVSSRPTVPVLTNALITADANGLTLTTTDMDITVRCTVQAEVEESGSTTLPVKRFTGIVRELPEGPIEVTVDEKDIAHMRCGASYFKMIGLAATEFPSVPTVDGGICYTLDKAVFADMLKKTHYAASTDDSRPVLNGVLLNFADGKLTCVATDGRRLALIEHEVEFPSENNRDVVLPTRAIAELLRILNGSGDLKIHLKGTQAIFEFDRTMMCCKLVDGVYPNFRQVILSQCDHRVAIPREEFLGVLRRVTLFTTEKSNAMRLTFEDNLLTIVASSPDVGEAHDALAVKYSGPKIAAIFNPEFMMDPLRTLTGDEVFIELNDAMSPGLIKSDIPFLYVLMPLRV